MHLLDDDGRTVLANLAYDAWGQLMSGSNPTPYGYKAQWGYYTDVESGILFLTHRYLDPATGRFLTRDPIGLEGGINLYAYVGNGVVVEKDPIGLRALMLPLIQLPRDIRAQIAACLAGAAWGWISECFYYREWRSPTWKATCMGCCTALGFWDLYKKRYGQGAVKALCASICGMLADLFSAEERPYFPPYPPVPPPGVGPEPGDPNRPLPGECIRLPNGRVVCG
ncbi:MAG: hypothetical protein KatS3mg023_1841 [Armatimonadota bacterium]|nr:MAG: hypothetical protein KatS3mg023_1841 [Armatimonadota bacterium]